ncbi:MAG: hypothetical protein OHK0029_20100 [Armatimonadaceae bacterium]
MATPEEINDLQERLRQAAHSQEALDEIQRFAAGLGKTRQRQEFFNTEGVLLVPPIYHQEAMERRLVSEEEDAFTLLQGDVIFTRSAYFMGERLTETYYLVASATCDLVPQRRQYAALFPLHRITPDDPNAKSLLGELLAFKSTRRMYLPPLPEDPENVLANAIEFDGIAQARLEDILLANRVASLGAIGWHILAAHLRSLFSRTGDSEVWLRRNWQSLE